MHAGLNVLTKHICDLLDNFTRLRRMEIPCDAWDVLKISLKKAGDKQLYNFIYLCRLLNHSLTFTLTYRHL